MTALLLFYLVFLIIFGLYSIAGIYHLWRFGYVGDLTRPAMVIYIVLSLGIIIATFGLIAMYTVMAA